jgi:Do/DeqQ family serine protease
MKMVRKFTAIMLIAFLGALLAVGVYSKIFSNQNKVVIRETQPIQLASMPAPLPQGNLPDLTYAAEKSIHSVVHIKTTITRAYSQRNPIFDFFYGDRGYAPEPQEQQASGSGVIISPDGYIVTNNHVIEDANNIEVVLNDNRNFKAKLIGRDPSTDIALIKIEEEGLAYLKWGNPETVKLGEWVLAVGNPFNLTSTVTAGIVSAKARSIRIMGGQMPLESFIQTDAAVNPGNSGGALVNQRGELIGINTAIASRTGSYTGYSFAVPASIASKVVRDLMEYGQVQRAVIGINIRDVNAELAEEKDLDKIEGVYVAGITEEGAAREAGIEEGDVIISVNAVKVNSVPELQEQVGKYRPGDEVNVGVKRDGKLKQYKIVLRNTRGGTSIMKESLTLLGAEFEEISNSQKERLRIRNGIQVVELNKGKLKDAGVEEGFIIVEVNRVPVNSVNDLKKILNKTQEGRPIFIEGAYPDGKWTYFAFEID